MNSGFSMADVEKCLLQQTKTYQKGTPVVFATNRENELFFVYFFDNTFYIVKVEYANHAFRVVYDYRRMSFLLEEFQYCMLNPGVHARLRTMNAMVEFIVWPQMNYQGAGCTFSLDQSALYKRFVQYVDTYRMNINCSAAERKNDNGYLELFHAAREINAKDKERILDTVARGDINEAIRQIQASTGLGIADCKSIAETPYMFL